MTVAPSPQARAPRTSTAALLAQAWPTFLAQLSIVLMGTIDTAMAGRLAPQQLAGVALGASYYMTVYLTAMSVAMALGPVAAHHYGAGRLDEVVVDLRQAAWQSLALSTIGIVLLSFPEPWFAMAHAEPAVVDVARGYLLQIAWGLPAAVGMRLFMAMNTAVSRPIATMSIYVVALALKAPLNEAMIHGFAGRPGLGGAGCGAATALLSWASLALAFALWRADPFYRRFRDALAASPGAAAREARWPVARRQWALLRLGVPIGMAVAFEVGSFSVMTVIAARFGAAVLGGHQVVLNLVSILFMVPLALGSAGGALVAQSLGAGDPGAARAAALRSMRVGVAIAAFLSAATWLMRDTLIAAYSNEPRVVASAGALIAWGAGFHVFDAMQGIAGFALRGYRVTTAPMLIYGGLLWGVGIGGGYALAVGATPMAAPLQAVGLWAAMAVGLSGTAVALLALLLRVSAEARAAAAPAPAG